MDSRLEEFIITKKIPNILFYGSENSNKYEILDMFLDKIYTNDTEKQNKILELLKC